jgi:hypothetical protein
MPSPFSRRCCHDGISRWCCLAARCADHSRGKTDAVFGNLAMSSVIVERQQQTVIAISRDRALDADQVLVRGVRREDIVNHAVGDANTRGPIAMLVGTT